MSLPRMARISLRLPSSWAKEINFQSRYPGGILIPKIGAASSSAFPDAGAEYAAMPATAATASVKKVIHFIAFLLIAILLANTLSLFRSLWRWARVNAVLPDPWGTTARFNTFDAGNARAKIWVLHLLVKSEFTSAD